MSKVYNFFLDIDGTLLGRGQTQLSQEVEKALRFAQSKGSRIFINTGRTKAFIPKYLKELDCIDGFCCGCGTYVEYRGKTVYEFYMTREKLYELGKLFVDYKLTSDLIYEGYDNMYYIGETLPWFTANNFIKVDDPEYFLKCETEPKVHKFSTHNNDDRRTSFFDDIKCDYDVMIFPHYVEGVPLGYNKGKAMKITEDLLCLDPSLSVAIGDSLNDAAMLRYAATSVAMGNATDEVKAMCTDLTDTVDNDGVAKIIYKLMKQ